MRPLTLITIAIQLDAPGACGRSCPRTRTRRKLLGVCGILERLGEPGDALAAMLDSRRMRVLNSSQMREADRRTIEEIGIPSIVLMENAGRQVVAAMEASFQDLAERHVAVL